MNIQSNIRKLNVIKFLRGFLFGAAMYFLLFKSHGLGATELFVIQAIFAIIVVIFEIPTGFVSDRYSRKLSISIGLFLASSGYFVYTQSIGFWGLTWAEILLAFGYCFVSGSDTSLLYDSLQSVDQTNEFKKLSGRHTSMANFAEAIGGISSGFIAIYGLNIPYMIDSIFVFVAFLISLTLVEPAIHRPGSDQSDISQIIDTIKYSWNNKVIFWLIMFSGFVGSITLSMVWFSQPFLELNGVPTQYFGIYRAISNLLVAVFGLFAHRVEEYIGSSRFMILLILISIATTAAIGIYPVLWVLPMFLVFQFVRGGARVIVQDELHIQTQSHMRATIQSISSMFFRLCFAVLGPIFGYIADIYSLGMAIAMMGTSLGLVCLYICYRYISLKG